jgi:hypothetical protein
MFEEASLERVPPSSTPSAPLVGKHPPDRAHQFDGQECQLQGLKLAIWLSTLAIDGGNPPPHGVIDTRIRDQEVFSLLDPQRLIIDQDLDGLPPETPIDAPAPADPADTPGVPGGVSPPVFQTPDTASRLHATNGALRGGAHGAMRGPTLCSRRHTAQASRKP